MKYLLIAGRVLFSLPFLVNGISHFLHTDAIASMIPSVYPQPYALAYLTGIALILAAISILTTKFLRLAGILLGIMLLIFALSIHLPSAMSDDPQMSMMGMTNFLKDTGLAGGAFILAAHYSGRV